MFFALSEVVAAPLPDKEFSDNSTSDEVICDFKRVTRNLNSVRFQRNTGFSKYSRVSSVRMRWTLGSYALSRFNK